MEPSPVDAEALEAEVDEAGSVAIDEEGVAASAAGAGSEVAVDSESEEGLADAEAGVAVEDSAVAEASEIAADLAVAEAEDEAVEEEDSKLQT